jgi:hypothetical protein
MDPLSTARLLVLSGLAVVIFGFALALLLLLLGRQGLRR